MSTRLIIWEVLCLALWWSVFCRSVRTSTTTRLDVRVAIFLVGVGSLLGLGAPLYEWEPDTITLYIIGSVVIMQVVAAQHWGKGVPEHFVKRQFLTRHGNRRKEDRA